MRGIRVWRKGFLEENEVVMDELLAESVALTEHGVLVVYKTGEPIRFYNHDQWLKVESEENLVQSFD